MLRKNGISSPCPGMGSWSTEGAGLGSKYDHRPSPGARKPLAWREGTQAPRCGCTSFLPSKGTYTVKVKGPQPQLPSGGEAAEAFDLELGGQRASEILLWALRGLGQISGGSRCPESSDRKWGAGVGATVCLSLGVPSSSPSNSPGPLTEAWPAQAPPQPPPESARILCAHMSEVRA